MCVHRPHRHGISEVQVAILDDLAGIAVSLLLRSCPKLVRYRGYCLCLSWPRAELWYRETSRPCGQSIDVLSGWDSHPVEGVCDGLQSSGCSHTKDWKVETVSFLGLRALDGRSTPIYTYTRDRVRILDGDAYDQTDRRHLVL
jgi:hypothetical protein